MKPASRPRQTFSERELQIFRAHGEWASHFIVYSLVVCFVILGGAFAIFEYTGADERGVVTGDRNAVRRQPYQFTAHRHLAGIIRRDADLPTGLEATGIVGHRR